MSIQVQNPRDERTTECIRKLLTGCKLLEKEADIRAEDEAVDSDKTVPAVLDSAARKSAAERFVAEVLWRDKPDSVVVVQPAGSFKRIGFATAVTLSFALLVGLAIAMTPSLRQVPDQRFAVDYHDHTISSVAVSPDTDRLYAGTAGDGMHSVRTRSEFLQHYTQESTAGGLLSDYVQKVTTQGRDVYLLCRDQEDSVRGLCRFDASHNVWQTLVGMQRFPSLTDQRRAATITDIESEGDTLYVATDIAGLGVYSIREHNWRHIYQQSQDGIQSNEVRDLQRLAAGRLYVATAAGVQELHNGQWTPVSLPAELSQPNIQSLADFGGNLAIRTLRGGLFVRQQDGWDTLASESSWQAYADQDLKFVLASSDARRWWCLARDGAVGEYHFDDRSWRSLPALPDPAISLAQHPTLDGRLLAATTSGVWELASEKAPWRQLTKDHLAAMSSGRQGVLLGLEGTEPNQPLAVDFMPQNGDRLGLVGAPSAVFGPRGVVAATLDQDGERLHVGTENGVSTYHVPTHTWSRPSPRELTESPVLELQRAGLEQLVLRSDGRIYSWNSAKQTTEHVLGGGELPQSLQSVSAVARSTQGTLLLASSEGLFAYDSRRHVGRKVAELAKPVHEMWADRGGVWLLVEGQPLYYADAGKLESAPAVPAPLKKLFASPETDGAIGLDSQGRVFHYPGSQSRPTTVVGDAAPGLDLNAVDCAAATTERLIVGGAKPHLYDIRSRSWHALALGPVIQVATTGQTAWLRTADKQLFRLDSGATAPRQPADRVAVTALESHGGYLAALHEDSSISLFEPNGQWREFKAPARGPGQSLLADKQLLVGGNLEHLDLATSESAQWWRFSLAEDQWHIIKAAEPFARLVALASAEHATYALSASRVYQCSFGSDQASQVVDEDFLSLRSGKGLVLGVDRQSRVWSFDRNGGERLTGSPLAGSGEVRDVAGLNSGLVVTTGAKSAILSPGLGKWQEIAAAAEIAALHTGGEHVFAVDREHKLWRLNDPAAKPEWKVQQLPTDDARVRSVVVGAGNDGKSLTVTTSDGAVLRAEGSQSATLRSASIPLGSPDDVVGIVPVMDGFLCALRTGKLLRCRSATLEWSRAEGPNATGFLQMLEFTPAAGQRTLWLLTDDQRLLVDRTGRGNDWKLLHRPVKEISLGKNGMLAILADRSELVEFDADGRRSSLIQATPPADCVLPKSDAEGSLVAAAEADAGDRQLLCLSDGTRIAAYDPRNRSWQAADVAAATLHSTSGGVYACSQSGEVKKVTVSNGKLVVSDVKVPAKHVAVAALPEANRLVLQNLGTVSLLTDSGELDTLVTRSLDTGEQTQIGQIAAHGKWLFVAFSSGELYGYHCAKREWKRLERIAGIKRLEAWNDQVWVETENAGQRQLHAWQDGDQRLTTLGGPLFQWAVSPAGIIVSLRDADNRLITSLWTSTRESRPLSMLPSPGPAEKQITAARANQLGLWLRDPQGIFSFDGERHAWSNVTPAADFALHSAHFGARSPILVDNSGTSWIGKASTQSRYPTYQFQAGPRGIKQLDAQAGAFAWLTEGGELRTASVEAPQTLLGKLSRTSAWSKESRAKVAMAFGKQLFLSSDLGEVAQYDLGTRRWTRMTSIPAAIDELFWDGKQLYASIAERRAIRLEKDHWQETNAVSQSAWSVGETNWKPNPAGGIAVQDEEPAAVPAPLTSAEPRRIAAEGDVLWIEMGDGSLLQYSSPRRRLVSKGSRPKADTTQRLGLVEVGRHLFFVAEHERVVFDLSGSSITRHLLGFEAKQVLVSNMELGFDSGTQLQVLPGARTLSGPVREAWLKNARVPAANRLQSVGEWRIVPGVQDSTAHLARKISGQWHPYLFNRAQGKFAWDDVLEGLTWGDRVIVATTAGIVVMEPDVQAPPRQLLELGASEVEPLKLRLLQFDDQHLVVWAGGNRTWTLSQPAGKEELTLAPAGVPESPWRIEQDEIELKFSAQLAGDSVLPISISAVGELGIDRCAAVGVFDELVYAATDDGLLAMPIDLSRVQAVHTLGAGTLLPFPGASGLLFRRASDQSVLAYQKDQWRPETTETWDLAMRMIAMQERSDLNAKISLPLAFDDGPQRDMEYRTDRFVCDSIGLNNGRILFTTDGSVRWLGNALGVLAIDQSGAAKALPRFFDIPGGVTDFRWQLHSDTPQLVVTAADGRQYTVTRDSLVARPQLSNSQNVRWNNASYLVEQTARRVQFVSGTGSPALVLDLDAHGFSHDVIEKVGTSSRHVWLANGNRLERVSPGPERKIEPFSLPEAGAVEFRRLGERLFAEVNGRIYLLPDEGQPKLLPLEKADVTRVRSGFSGRQWRVANVANLAGLQFLTGSGNWLPLRFVPERGFSCDLITRAIVSSGDLFAETADGIARMPQANVSLDGLSPAPLTLVQGTAPNLQQMLLGAGGRLWAQVSNGWQRFDPQTLAWRVEPTVPAADLDKFATLAESRDEVWVRTQRGIEIRRRAGGESTGVLWGRAGQFALQDVLGAAETATALWFLTPAGLWKQNVTNGQITAVDTRSEFQASRGTFRQSGGSWYLAVEKGQDSAVYRLQNEKWARVAPEANPFRQSQVVWSQTKFRVVRFETGLRFELQAGANRWLPVQFDASRGAFSFQVATDAAGADNLVHALTPSGIVTWSRNAAELAFVAIHDEYKMLRVDAKLNQPLVSSQGKTWHDYDDGQWKPHAESAAGEALLVNRQWRVLRPKDRAAVIQRKFSGQTWVELPLAGAGDFQYRRPTTLAMAQNMIFALAGDSLVEYTPLSQKTPANLTPRSALATVASSPLSGVFVHNDAVHLSTGSQVVRRNAAGSWEQADQQLSTDRSRTLLSTQQWRWVRNDQGMARIEHLVGNSMRPLVWDSAAGRFTADRAADAALGPGALFLSVAEQVVRINSDTGRTMEMFDAQVSPGRFGYDHIAKTMLLRPAANPSVAAPIAKSAAAWALGEPTPLSPQGNCFTQSYLDSEWSFALQEQPQVSWNRLASGITGGRFLHDVMRNMLADHNNCWIETAAGLIRYRLPDADTMDKHWRWDASYAWPQSGFGRLVAIANGLPQIRVGEQMLVATQPADQWQPAPDNAPQERVLIDTPFWRWTRGDRLVATLTKLSDQPGPRDLLSAGRFPFDVVRAIAADGANLWLGLDEGVTQRAAADGRFVRWYSLGETDTGRQTLGKIVRMGRFSAAGDPLSSLATEEESSAATLYALNAQDQVWAFDAAASCWRSAQHNPWQAPGGLWEVRSKSLQVLQSPAGERKLLYRLSPEEASKGGVSTVALLGGRFTTDVIRSATILNNDLYLATDAGIEKTDQGGGLLHFWPTDSTGTANSLAACRSIDLHDKQHELFCHTANGAYCRLDSTQNQWLPFTPEQSFRETADVLHSDRFWTWRRWNRVLEVIIAQANAQPYDGPVFVDGRFSFDVIRDFHVAESGQPGGQAQSSLPRENAISPALWAITAAGLLQLDPRDMSVISLSRQAIDVESQGQIPMPVDGAFQSGDEVRIHSAMNEFTWRDSHWIRTHRTAPASEQRFADGEHVVTIWHLSTSGIEMTIGRADGPTLWTGTAFHGIPRDQITGMGWLNGEVWLSTQHDILHWRAPK